MKTTILYHQVKPGVDCADGIAAAWVAHRKYPDAEIIGVCYGEEPPLIEVGSRLVIVDFSYSRTVLEHYKKHCSELIVIDHHKTAMQDLQGFSNAIFDMEECGATLAWKTFFPDESMPFFLEFVRDRDLWEFQLAETEEIHEAMGFIGRTFKKFDVYAQWHPTDFIERLARLGKSLLKEKRQRVAKLAKTAAQTTITAGMPGYDSITYSAMLVDLESHDLRLTSDVAAAVYKKHPDKDFVIIQSWNREKRRYDLSFRSDKNGKNFDVSAIAKEFNGGGHRNAAGGYSEERLT